MATIITSGTPWVDIDAESSGRGLYEIMVLSGEKDIYLNLSQIKSSSVTKSLLDLPFQYDYKEITSVDKLIIVDCNDPYFLGQVCSYNLENIIQIYDHHPEGVDYWKQKIGENAKIEPIGACATLIVELAIERQVLKKITKETRLFLISAIVSHSMNFKAGRLTTRDRQAYEILKKSLGLDDSYIEKYFKEVESEVMKDPIKAFKNDFKSGIKLKDKVFNIGQLELWDAENFITTHKNDILKMISSVKSDISFSIHPSISEGNTYFIPKDDISERFLISLLGAKKTGDFLFLDKLILRKEVIEKIINNS